MGRASTTDACVWDNSDCEGTPHCPPRCPRFFDATGSPVIVRPAEGGDADIDRLAEMYADFAADHRTLGLPPRKRAGIDEWLSGIFETGWNLLATVEGRVVGHVAVVPADSPTPEFVIFVHQSFQGRGIGTELLRQVFAYAGDENHEALTLALERENRQAFAVYQNVGFETVRETAHDLEMELVLDEPLVRRARRPPAYRDS